MPSVSHSEVDSYLLCRRKHYYGYGLSLQRVSESDSLNRGTSGHAVLETFYKKIIELGGSDPKAQRAAFGKALQAALDFFNELEPHGVGDTLNPGGTPKSLPLRQMLFDWYFANEPFVLQGYTIWAVEKKFALEYEPSQIEGEDGKRYPFVVDLIVRSPEGKIIVVDHKFVYDFYYPDVADLQPQIPKYIGALRALNYRVDYGMYNMIRYRNQKELALEKVVQQLVLKPNPVRVQTTFSEQIGVADELMERKLLPIEVQGETAYRTANKMVCNSCSFQDICKTELSGGNTALMIKTEYKVRERRSFDVSEERAEVA
jgi:hypothetical protein